MKLKNICFNIKNIDDEKNIERFSNILKYNIVDKLSIDNQYYISPENNEIKLATKINLELYPIVKTYKIYNNLIYISNSLFNENNFIHTTKYLNMNSDEKYKIKSKIRKLENTLLKAYNLTPIRKIYSLNYIRTNKLALIEHENFILNKVYYNGDSENINKIAKQDYLNSLAA